MTKSINRYFYLFFIFFTSCATFKNTKNNKNRIILNKENIQLLNGKYNNKSHIPPIPLFNDNFNIKRFNSEKIGEHYIQIKAINRKEINVSVWINNQPVKNYFLRGNLKDGYFELKREYLFIPLFIINIFSSSKFRIGILKNKNIITDFEKKEFGTVYFFQPFFNNYSSLNTEHPRIISKKDTTN